MMKQCLQVLYLVFSHLADSRETPHACGVAPREMSLLRTEMVESDVKTASASLACRWVCWPPPGVFSPKF